MTVSNGVKLVSNVLQTAGKVQPDGMIPDGASKTPDLGSEFGDKRS